MEVYLTLNGLLSISVPPLNFLWRFDATVLVVKFVADMESETERALWSTMVCLRWFDVFKK